MPAKKLIKAREAAEMIGCHPATLNRGTLAGTFKRIPLNPKAKRKAWLYERKEIEAFIVKRERGL